MAANYALAVVLWLQMPGRIRHFLQPGTYAVSLWPAMMFYTSQCNHSNCISMLHMLE